jgi:hypothetical protein
MKSKIYTFIILFFVTLFTACKKNEIDHGGEYIDSYVAWTKFKESSGNSYRYMVASGSWTGIGTETIITVQNGKPVQRSFVMKGRNQSGQIAVLEEWEETTPELNAHPAGFDPLTLDEIYELARTQWLTKREGATVYFEARNNGMISSCGYVEERCADDCFRGVTIGFIEKL